MLFGAGGQTKAKTETILLKCHTFVGSNDNIGFFQWHLSLSEAGH